MEDIRRLLRTVATDRRVWGVTLVLTAWPVAGILTGSLVVQESASPLVYAYLLALGAVVREFPSSPAFWAGFVGFCFVIAAVLVGAFEWLRARTPAAYRERLSLR